MIKKLIINTTTLSLPSIGLYKASMLFCTSFDRETKEANVKLNGDRQIDELKNYESYLIKHNLSLKKAHQKLRTEEERIIKKYLSEQRFSQVISFLLNNSHRKLCNLNTAVFTDKSLTKSYSTFSEVQKRNAAYSLVSFRQNRFFNLYKSQIEKQILSKNMQDIDIESLIVYLYGQIVTYKNMDFIKSLLSKKQIKQTQALELIYQCLFLRQYKGIYRKQLTEIIKYIQLMMNPALNKIEHQHVNELRQRSHLEIEVQSFLKVLELGVNRQRTVNNFNIDFMIELKQKGKTKNIALQVNGNYHYTLNGKLKGRQILRNLIINQCTPLRIVHQQDFLLSKGYRNKLAYIESLLTLDEVNWQCKNRGTDSSWQVVAPEELLMEPNTK